MDAEKPTYYGLINPVPGLTGAEQRELIAQFAPAELFTVGKDGDLDQFARMMRPDRHCAVAYAGLLADHRGGKLHRMDSLIATKVAIHKRGSLIVEASGRSSDKDWLRMRRDGEEMCRRLAQGRKSALNGRKGSQPYEFADKHLSRFALIMERGKNDPERNGKITEYCKAQRLDPPKRTWLWTKLPALLRERGLSE